MKLEIDTNPPAGATIERDFLDFPVTHPVELWDLPSSFARTLHAVLCHRHLEGRDWFDFRWYVGRRVRPNLALLRNAIQQTGPWAGQGIAVDAPWLVATLRDVVDALDWKAARADVEPFLAGAERAALTHWGPALFGQTVERLAREFDA